MRGLSQLRLSELNASKPVANVADVQNQLFTGGGVSPEKTSC